MQGPTISIVLACYKPMQFIGDQLRSLQEQTRLPDELIVIDDASPDGSFADLNQICQTLPFETTIVRNSSNLGAPANFEKGCSLTRGDLLFLCDQDDVWEPWKVAIMGERFASDAELLLLFADATVTDEQLHPEGSLFASQSFSEWEKRMIRSGRAFDILLRRSLVTGATAALRRTLFERACPFPKPGWFHDEWMALSAAFFGKVDFLDQKVIRYRQHRANVVGLASFPETVRQRLAMQATYYRSEVERYENAANAFSRFLAEWPGAPDAAQKMGLLQRKLAFLKTRRDRPGNIVSRVAQIANMWPDYRRFALGWRSAAADVLPNR